MACSAPARDAATAPRIEIVDDFGDTLRLAAPAARIVSLSPVTTEALFALGAGARVTGRTHWDAYPAAALQVPDLGNGMGPNVEAVLATHPDLVVLYASSGNRAAAQAFRRAGVQTLTVHTDRVADLPRALHMLGLVIGDTAIATVVADSVARSLDAVRASRTGAAPTVFWHVWDSPVMTIGAGSYLNELVEIAGARNVFADLAQPSPQVTLESVAQRNPDYVLAGPVAAKRLKTEARWQAIPAVRLGHVLSIDTTIVGRPGVRMGEAARHLRALLDSASGAKK
jgi:ABC-type Fe3+-hydroxamate transport system substrate-binding protein